MYERSMLMFLYANSPVHFGAGVSLGAVDLPVQRERHTGYPMAQGSGLKGALRHHLEAGVRNGGAEAQDRKKRVKWLFGPDGEGEQARDHAGAVAFGDGRLLLFPVRSLIGTFAYCTSAVSLGRLRRDIELAGVTAEWQAPGSPPAGKAWVARGSGVMTARKVVLEDFDLTAEEREDVGTEEGSIARWIADHALPQSDAFEHFRARVRSHLVVLDDELFAHLTRLATVVEPHVKIDDDTGTAAGTAFFYAEHLPPDSLLWSLVGIASPRGRREDREELQRLGLVSAEAAEVDLRNMLDGKTVQAGAEATTGRGLMHVRFVWERQR
jgi:CRISPR-associated protein Cmr4